MGKHKNRINNEVVEDVEVSEEMELPAEVDEESDEIQETEGKKVKTKKVRRNLLQFVGDGIKAAGDGLASFSEKHPVGSTVAKVGAAGVAIGGVALAVVAAVKNGHDDAVDAESYEEEDLDYYADEDLDTDDSYAEEDTTASDETETEEATTEETVEETV